MGTNKVILDRVVVEQRLTRSTYAWWRYYIENNTITILPLKQQLPSLDSVFLALLRDFEFCKTFLNTSYAFKNTGKIVGVKEGDNLIYKFLINKTKEPLLMVKMKDRKLLYPILKMDLFKFIGILLNEHPENIYLKRIDDNYNNYRLSFHSEERRPYYKISYMENMINFKEMNIKGTMQHFVSKYFAGLTKKDRKLKLFSYSDDEDWLKTFHKGTMRYISFKEKFSKSFRKYYIFYLKSGLKLTGLNNKDIIKYVEPIMKENNCRF